jgi:hypothetical protein
MMALSREGRWHSTFLPTIQLLCDPERIMIQKLALTMVVAVATCGDASAGLYHHHHYSYGCVAPVYGYGYAAPVYGYGYVAPVYGVAYAPAAPVAYYPAPVYRVPVVQPAVIAPVYGYAPPVTTIRYRANPHRSVYRVRYW